MAAQYFVTAEPGAPVPGQGLIRPGEVFTAPGGFVPSVTLRPVNEEAAAELEKAFERAEDLLLERISELQGADRARVRLEIEELQRRRPQATQIATEEELGQLRATLPGQRTYTKA
jgi:hypothetical protein